MQPYLFSIRAACFLLAGICCTAAVSSLNAQEESTGHWAQFRGTDGSGIADDAAAPPTQWDLGTQTAWSTKIPGIGWSSPVYDGDKIWLTTAVTKEATEAEIAAKLKGDRMAAIKTLAKSADLHAICISIESGEILHNILLGEINEPDPINPMNSYASPTPAISNGKVVCHFGSYGTWCLDASSGEKIWDKKFVIDHSVGPGSSPMIFDGKVVLVCDGMDLQYIATLDLNTGKEVWKTDRPPIRATNGEFRKAYCTPVEIVVDGKKQLIIPGAQWVVSYDPANGQEIWRAEHGDGFSLTPMPVYESGLVIFSTGYGRRTELVAIDPTGSGDVTKSKVVWRKPGAPTMPSMIAKDGQIYAINDKGILSVLDAKTGSEIRRARVKGNYSASPLLAGGNLYFSSREGLVSVIACSAELEKVATNELGSAILASPILIGNDLLIRTEKELVRIKGQ
ncbi:MAG: PQQ-binding-like beta-propeller repeat protein [Mariniblastus sp.]